jgi:transcriptional regulator of acetoin/glycerol metabolism
MRNLAPFPSALVRKARLQLVEQGIPPGGAINDLVARSWSRSLRAGLSPIGRIDCDDNLAGAALDRVRTRNHDLISHSEPVMEHLFEQVRHSNSMVVLADAQGVLMRTLGDLDFLSKAERVALTFGATWAEGQRGTNAIGTALAESREVEIHGAEHYLERNGFLTCAAAPILSAQGQLMGILDISGDQRSRHPHTLGLVATSARMIENSLVLATCRQHILVQMHPRAEGIGSVAQGILAVTEDGWLVGANRKALEWLGLQAADLGAATWAQLFDLPLPTLLGRPGSAAARARLLHTAQGQALFAQVHPHTQARQQLTVTVRSTRDALGAMDTGDATWRTAADKARRVADKGIPLLVLGESGVGKELFAKAVHASSQRRGKPFVAVNCAAIPEALIEAELFGYLPGAYTGANRHGASGRLRDAHGGTLFLDEIGDMPLAMQTRLLRVLQERQVTPLGSSTPVPVDFALVCATHQDLERAVEQGRFRADLYYRIQGLALRLPALRERTDFDALTQRLLEEHAPGQDLQILPELLAALRAHRWPGNLRQYALVLKTAVALLDSEETVIDWAHLPDDLTATLRRSGAPLQDAPVQNLQQLSHRAIGLALENARGNVSAAARQLGISRQTLYRKLQANAPTGALSVSCRPRVAGGLPG